MDGWRVLGGGEFYRRALAVNAAGNNRVSGQSRPEGYHGSFQPSGGPAGSLKCSLLAREHAGEVARYYYVDTRGEHHFQVFCQACVTVAWTRQVAGETLAARPGIWRAEHDQGPAQLELDGEA